MSRQTQALAATTGAVSWEIYRADGFNVPRIDLTFDVAPTSAGYLYLKKDSVLGAAYDAVIRIFSPVGLTSMSIEGMHGLVDGDKLIVEYANPDGVSITGSATVEIPLLDDLYVAGMTISDGVVRSKSTEYRRYYHVSISSVNPGASGATWVDPTADYFEGWKLDAASENVTMATDTHGDWDASADPELEFKFTVNVDNSAGNAADEVDFELICYYGSTGSDALKTQTINESVVVGACDQYDRFKAEIDIDRNATDNPFLPGESINIILSVPATGDITDVTINEVAFYYPTTHVGIESGDV